VGVLVFLCGLFFYAKGAAVEGFVQPTTKCPNLLIQQGSRFYLHNTNLVKVPGVNPVEFENLEDYIEFLEWQRSQGIRCPVLFLQQSFDPQGNQVYKIRPSVSEPQGGLPSVGTGSGAGIVPGSPQIGPESGLIDGTSQLKSGSSAAGVFPGLGLDFLHPSSRSPVGIALQNANPPPLDPVGEFAYPTPSLLVDAGHNDPPFNENSYPGYDRTNFYVGKTTPLDAMDIAAEKAPVSANPMDVNWGGAEYTQSLVNSGYYKANEVSIMVS